MTAQQLSKELNYVDVCTEYVRSMVRLKKVRTGGEVRISELKMKETSGAKGKDAQNAFDNGESEMNGRERTWQQVIAGKDFRKWAFAEASRCLSFPLSICGTPVDVSVCTYAMSVRPVVECAPDSGLPSPKVS